MDADVSSTASASPSGRVAGRRGRGYGIGLDVDGDASAAAPYNSVSADVDNVAPRPPGFIEQATAFVSSAAGAIQQRFGEVFGVVSSAVAEQNSDAREFDRTVRAIPEPVTNFNNALTRTRMFDDALETRANSPDDGFRHVMASTADPIRNEMFASAAMSADWNVAVKNNGVLFERDGQRVFATDDTVVTQSGTAAEIEAMLELATNKGWTAIEFEGDDAFKQQAMLAARERGMPVCVQEADQHILRSVDQKRNERIEMTFDRAPNQADVPIEVADAYVAAHSARADDARADVPIEVADAYVAAHSPQAVDARADVPIEVADAYVAAHSPQAVDARADVPIEVADAYVAAHSPQAVDAFSELPVFQPRPYDFVSDRNGVFASQQIITVVGRTAEGEVVGRDGAGYAKVARSAFENVPQAGETFIISRGADGLDSAKSPPLEQEQSLDRLAR